MRYSTQIKSIGDLKANAAEVPEQLSANRQPLVITRNDEAGAVTQDVASYEATQGSAIPHPPQLSEQRRLSKALLELPSFGRHHCSTGVLQ